MFTVNSNSSFKCCARRRAFLTAAFVACSLVVFAGCKRDVRYASSASESGGASSSQPPRTNLPMPPVASSHSASSGWTLLDGRRETLADYRGKVLIIDLYATYCPPCRDEIPHLNNLLSLYESQGLRVVGLNVGDPDDRRKVPGFASELEIQYDLGNPDWEFVEAISAGETSIPRTYVFDRQGKLVDYSVGYDPQIAAQLERAVQSAVASDN